MRRALSALGRGVPAAVFVIGASLAACTTVRVPPPPPIAAEAVGEVRPGSGILKGYLSPEQ
jgi:hypothetical protein